MEYHFEDKDDLAKDLLKLLQQGSLHDVKIKLSDGEINANKDILMARSDYFATMFSNNKFVEGETGSVDMSYCSKAVMGKIIKFLFSGTVTFEDLSLAQLLELTHVSEMMLLQKFYDKLVEIWKGDSWREICGGQIIYDREEVHFLCELIQGLKLADKYNLSLIAKWIMLDVAFDLKDIMSYIESSDSFKTLPFHWMKEIIQYHFDDPYLLMPTFEVFKAFTVWLSENEVTIDERREIADSFDLVFEDFTVEELMTSVRDSGLYPSSKIDQRVLEIVKEKDLKIKEQDLKIKQLERQS